jgi:hypothetical protein
MSAQRIALGIAPAYDAGGDDFGPLLVQHLTLYIYQDLLGNKQFAPSLLSPGGVYTPLDTSWLTEYVQDRPELDLLLVATLKPTVSDKAATTIAVQLDLLDAHTGDTKSTWTVTDVTNKSKSEWFAKGEAAVTAAINGRANEYGGVDILTTSTDFEKQPIGHSTAHLADEIRDTLPAHLGGFVAAAGKPADPPAPAVAPPPCTMHTRITYDYRHSVSHSYTLLANNLDETTTITDGISTFKVPEGPLLLQFTVNDAPYRLTKEPIYQLSTFHSCKSDTLVIDLGQGGEAHQHWQ